MMATSEEPSVVGLFCWWNTGFCDNGHAGHCDMLMGIWFHLPTLSALILLLTIRDSTLAPCVARLVNDVLSGSSSNGLSKTY